MKKEEFMGFNKEGHHRGERHKRKEHISQKQGAKTFRRGRALAFLEMMNTKRSTIKQQLDAPEFQTINQILIGELKAIDMVINEFSQLFEIHESETMEIHKDKIEDTDCNLIEDKESEEKDNIEVE